MTSGVAIAARPPVRQRAGRHWSRYRAGYLFVLPAFLLYAVFMIYPFFQSIYFSFIEWNGADPVKKWVGLDNYQALIHDHLFWTSLKHNVIWVIIGTDLADGDRHAPRDAALDPTHRIHPLSNGLLHAPGAVVRRDLVSLGLDLQSDLRDPE